MNKKKTVRTAVLAMFCLLFWVPVLVMFPNSFMGPEELKAAYGGVLGGGGQAVQMELLPVYPTLRPYVELLLDSPDFFVMFWNSVKQVVPILLGQVLVGMPAAWAFGRYRFTGRRILFLLYMILMIMPFQVTMVSSYLVLSNLSLMDTHLAIILPGVFSAFPVFIMQKFFHSIPDALVEAAMVDGAGQLKIFLHVGVPLGMPGIMASVLLNFLEYWNAIEQPMTFLKEQRLWPLSLYLPDITADKAGAAWSASVIMMVLPVLLFLMGQETLEQGIAASGIKE